MEASAGEIVQAILRVIVGVLFLTTVFDSGTSKAVDAASIAVENSATPYWCAVSGASSIMSHILRMATWA